MHHTSVLYPRDWTRFDPSLNSYSPLAEFSSHTLREHNETLDKLNIQLETIARKLSEINLQEAEDHRRYTRMIDALQREESDIVALLTHNRMRITELEQASNTEVLRRREAAEERARDMRELQDELNTQMSLENDLMVMRRQIEDKLIAAKERQDVFRREYRHGMTILEEDHKEAKVASIHADSFVQGGRLSTAHSPSRQYAARASAGFDRPLSPNRAPVVSGPIRGSPPRQTASSHVFGASAVQRSATLSPTRRPASVPVYPPAVPLSPRPPPAPAQPSVSMLEEYIPTQNPFRRLSDAAERLHAACRDGRAEEARALLRLDQNIAAEQHPLTGNTALHVLCSLPSVNENTLSELCTIDSELLRVFNKEGLTPFHVACLNTMDSDNRLKTLLVTNYNCSPHQPSGMGETVVHLCARNDIHHNALRWAIERMRVDPDARVCLTDRFGKSQQMHALDVAEDCGDVARYNREYLRNYFREKGLK